MWKGAPGINAMVPAPQSKSKSSDGMPALVPVSQHGRLGINTLAAVQESDAYDAASAGSEEVGSRGMVFALSLSLSLFLYLSRSTSP